MVVRIDCWLEFVCYVAMADVPRALAAAPVVEEDIGKVIVYVES